MVQKYLRIHFDSKNKEKDAMDSDSINIPAI